MEKVKKPPKGLAQPLVKGDSFRQIYASGAIGNFTPDDYRLMFYTLVPQLPKEVTQLKGVPVAGVVEVEVIMSHALMKRTRDLLDRQIKKFEAKKKK